MDRRAPWGSAWCWIWTRASARTALTVVSEQDILGERLARPAAKRRRPENFLTEVSALYEGDLVVHVEHGIGRYEGLATLEVGGAPHDCLRVVYHGGDKLFVPVENIEVLSRYGSEESGVELDRLGQGGWQARKARVKARIKDIADELIKVAAARELKQRRALLPAEGVYDEFCARFPYPETEDQHARHRGRPWTDLAGRPAHGPAGLRRRRLRQDRVALRAAFVAVMAGRQVAIVVPTTLLARQHCKTFPERFAGLPVKHRAALAPGERRAEATQDQGGPGKKGLVDIVIGTHALAGQEHRLPRPGPADRRRGAALRRQAEGAPEAAARGRPRA